MIRSTDIHAARILIVDDQAANLALLERMLTGAGYACPTSTTNPKEVCELHRKNRYDLILLDLHMPGMNGFEVMEGLQAIEQNGYLPVLVITAQPGHKLGALQAGAKDFVSKPFELAEVLMRVHNMLEVRLLHLEARDNNVALERTIRELEASREVVRLKTLEEQKKSDRELALAQETQRSLLPRFLPSFENFQLRAFNSPTRYIGGDFYEFLHLASGEWVGILADVSGKGMPAALLSSMVLGALSMEFRAGAQPQEVVSRINRLLCEKSLEHQFVTLFLFVLSSDGNGQFISAGHNPAYLCRARTGKIEVLNSEAPFLGMFGDASYECRNLHLDCGDILVVYSDGVTEAEDPQAEVFGEKRLRGVIKQWAPSGGKVVEQKLLEAVAEFTKGMPQTDDVTFMVVEKYQ